MPAMQWNPLQDFGRLVWTWVDVIRGESYLGFLLSHEAPQA
jgi:hypothetical protein